MQNIEILKRRRITSDIDFLEGMPTCRLLGDSETGWGYWNDIRDFSKQAGVLIERICCDLDFSVFDE